MRFTVERGQAWGGAKWKSRAYKYILDLFPFVILYEIKRTASRITSFIEQNDTTAMLLLINIRWSRYWQSSNLMGPFINYLRNSLNKSMVTGDIFLGSYVEFICDCMLTGWSRPIRFFIITRMCNDSNHNNANEVKSNENNKNSENCNSDSYSDDDDIHFRR